jgi:lysozyme family protein
MAKEVKKTVSKPLKIAENFAKCLPLLFDDEGGYCNDAHDPGGATKWGITWRDLEAWVGHAVTTQDVRNITQDLAAQIYKAKYWTTVHGDDLPSGVDYMVFDYGVNSGNSRAIKALQGIVGVAQDGVVGGLTLAAVKRVDPVYIINSLFKKRMGFLESLRTWIYFGRGWKRRVNGVYNNSLAWAKASAANTTPVVEPLVVNPPAPPAPEPVANSGANAAIVVTPDVANTAPVKKPWWHFWQAKIPKDEEEPNDWIQKIEVPKDLSGTTFVGIKTSNTSILPLSSSWGTFKFEEKVVKKTKKVTPKVVKKAPAKKVVKKAPAKVRK